jgi:hypothetical protein
MAAGRLIWLALAIAWWLAVNCAATLPSFAWLAVWKILAY